MGLTTLIGPFYKPLNERTFRQAPSLGQLAWVPVPAYPPIPQILDVERDNPRGHESARATVRNVTRDDFKKRRGLPVYKLQLADNEELMVQKAKRRLAIVIAPLGTAFDDVDPLLRQAGKKHLQERNVLVAPLYGIQSENHPTGFPELMRHRIDALLYSQFFFCPANSSPIVYDGVARLDRLFPVVPKDPAAYDPLPLALSDDALPVLLALLRLRFGSKSEPEIDVMRELLVDTIPEQFRPSSSKG
ncbi:hypothetical protein [Melittangium boletus]|uniref:Uncharacterized protein n=1 Tax=Melittangium boletus DSM 14713 TaxID=1294270 RepID=A0A250ID31_9BACT|nr:hypothetical protein [Melittangium boletus]ATB29675.1 hypothetical protein MEBOL_003130 [Melittangium boletus DSM 14713]